MGPNLHDIHVRAMVAKKAEWQRFLADRYWLSQAIDEDQGHVVQAYAMRSDAP